jgi:hypothetical protein
MDLANALGKSWCLLAGLLFLQPLLAQSKMDPPAPALLGRAEGEKAARALLSDLLARRPEKDSTNTGALRVRERNRTEREIPVRFEIYSTATNWVSTYESLPAGQNAPGMKLTVTHSDDGTNTYLLAGPFDPGQDSRGASPRPLDPGELFAPFAGSDFWIADLGLEFLRWPHQRVLKREMRRSMPCQVLESTSPRPAPGGYSRVVSWIHSDSGGIVHADAYDAAGRLLKQFAPTSLEKVDGRRQLEEMEMLNRLTGSRSWIKFNLGAN